MTSSNNEYKSHLGQNQQHFYQGVGVNNSVQRNYTQRNSQNNSNISATTAKHHEHSGWHQTIQNQVNFTTYKGGQASSTPYEMQHYGAGGTHSRDNYDHYNHQLWNSSAASGLPGYHPHHNQHVRQSYGQGHHQQHQYLQKPLLNEDTSAAAAARYYHAAGWHTLSGHRGNSAHQLREQGAPPSATRPPIRDFIVPPAIGGRHDATIEDFKHGRRSSLMEDNQGIASQQLAHHRKKPNLAAAASDSGGDFDGILSQKVKVNEQERKNNPFNDNCDVDIGIGRVTPPNEQSDYAGPDDFRCLRRLTRRMSSPLCKLLQDANSVMISFDSLIDYMEALEAPYQDSPNKVLKTESAAENATILQRDSAQETQQSFQDRWTLSSQQMNQSSAQDSDAIKPVVKQSPPDLKGETHSAESNKKRGRRRKSSIELICREKLDLKKMKNDKKRVQKRLRRVLYEFGKNQELQVAQSTARSVKQRAKSREQLQQQQHRLACKIKKQEHGQGGMDGAQSTETTPKTPKFSEKSRKDRNEGSPELKLNITDQPPRTVAKPTKKPSATAAMSETVVAPASKTQKNNLEIKSQTASEESSSSETSSEDDQSSESSSNDSMDEDYTKRLQKHKRGRPKKDAQQMKNTEVAAIRPRVAPKQTAAAMTTKVTSTKTGIGKKMELMQSLKDIEKKRMNEKMTVQKRGQKVIRKPQSAKQPRINKATVAAVQFHCEACDEDFTTGQALGGHMSRVHPGQSNSYARKIQRREERTFDRELLRLAKLEHSRIFGTNTPLDRVKIRRFKRNLRTRILKGEFVEGYMGNVDV